MDNCDHPNIRRFRCETCKQIILPERLEVDVLDILHDQVIIARQQMNWLETDIQNIRDNPDVRDDLLTEAQTHLKSAISALQYALHELDNRG